MLPVRQLAEICDKYLPQKGTINLSPKEQDLIKRALKGDSMNEIAKDYYGDTASNRGFVKMKAKVYDKLISTFIQIESGNTIQKVKAKIHREYAAIHMMSLFGLSSALIPASKRLLSKCQKYSMHAYATELSRKLAKRYLLEREHSKAEKFHKRSIYHNDLYKKELEYDWQFNQIRSKVGSEAFVNAREDIAEFIELIEENTDSIRINYIRFELLFFLAYIDGDYESQVRACRSAINYFQKLPYQHYLAINLFVFHLLEIFISHRKFAKAELLILSNMADQKTIGAHAYRFHEILLCIYLNLGHKDKALTSFTWLQKNVHKTGFPNLKIRHQIYALYIALLNKETISLRKLHYNLNKIKREDFKIQVPFMIGKIVYYLIHNNPSQSERELTHLVNYSRIHLDKRRHNRTITMIKALKDINDVRYNKPFVLPPPVAQIGRDSIEIIPYETLLEMCTVSSY